VLAGGLIVDALSWRWILFINLPIGLAAAFAAQRLLLEGRDQNATRNFDLLGALSATAGLTLLVFGIVRTDTSGWGDPTTLITIAIGVALLGAFLLIEGVIAKAPLMPLRLFRSRRLSAANVIIMLVGAATFGMWFFFTLYLQQVLGYSALKAGIIFLPMTIALVIGSTLASRMTMRIGLKRLQIAGMGVLTLGLLWFTRLSTHPDYLGVMLPAGLLASIGMPFAYIPATISATAGVAPQEAGLASAVTSNARLFGGALGLAVLATIASSHTSAELHYPTAAVHTLGQALVSGFNLAFWVAAGIAAVGVLVAILGTPAPKPAPVAQPQKVLAAEA
ncbi:MAG: MFS transporter, partial [Solirubrobacteraceae bacterium]